MSVYIKGIEMPKSCYVCPFCDYVSARCGAVKGTPYTPTSRYDARAEWCPLIPVPDHGDLIDRDVLKSIKYDLPNGQKAFNRGFHNGVLHVQRIAMDAPVVICGDKEENDD